MFIQREASISSSCLSPEQVSTYATKQAQTALNQGLHTGGEGVTPMSPQGAFLLSLLNTQEYRGLGGLPFRNVGL